MEEKNGPFELSNRITSRVTEYYQFVGIPVYPAK